MKLYRVLHIPSGMFYRPQAWIQIKWDDSKYPFRTNLSKTPKVYSSKPSIGMLSGSFYDHTGVADLIQQTLKKNPKAHRYSSRISSELRPMLSKDWMIETMVDGKWTKLENLS